MNLEVITQMGAIHARMGDDQSARAMLKRLVETSLFAAMIHAALGEIDAAFELIDRAIERRFNPTCCASSR